MGAKADAAQTVGRNSVPDVNTVDAFVSLVKSGDYVGAIERFYSVDASMQENNDQPRVGRDVLVAGERQFMRMFKSIAVESVGPALINGDYVVVRWRFAFEPFEGPTRMLDEIAWQKWRADRIVEEKFFYDPKQIAPVSAGSEADKSVRE